MDGKHHACPKCGGNDRFRFTDVDGSGSLVCNQCGKCGDVLAAYQWWTGCDFKAALKHVAEHCGLQPKKREKRSKSLGDIFKPNEPAWNESAVAMFCGINQGITQVGIERARAVMGQLYGDTAVGIPAAGESLTDVVNYVCMGLFRKHLAVFSRDQKTLYRKKTATQGPGLLGGASLDFIRAGGIVEVCWKVEGPTSMMALLSVIPESAWGKHVVVSNVHGASEKPKWMAAVLAKCPMVHIVPDIDQPGVASANMWSKAIAAAGGTSKVVTLPYEHVEGQPPKDLRDFVQEYGESSLGLLMSRAQQAEEAKPAVVELNSNRDIPRADARVLEDLEIDVLYEDEGEKLWVYSQTTRKISKIIQVDRVTYERMLQVCGLPAKVAIATSADAKEDHQHTITTVKRALAMAGSGRRLSATESEMIGPGIYQVTDYDGRPTGSVACCNRSSVSILDQNGVWTLGSSPRVDGMLFDLGEFKWFDHEDMAPLIERARDPAWCNQSWDQLISILARWTWGRQRTDPTLVAGLIGATFCQSVWQWRPQVAIRGKTNAGKSALLQFLFGDPDHGTQGLFGRLAFLVSESSAAGIRQSVSRSSLAVAIDEWDGLRATARKDILRLLRTSGPGSKITMGTAGQKAIKFGLRHVCWIAGIYCGMEDESDRNRFLEFELVLGNEQRRRDWSRPTQDEWEACRRNLTAMAVVHCQRAALMADRMAQTKMPLNERIVRSLCVPAALVAASLGMDQDKAIELVKTYAAPLVAEQDDPVPTEIDLLQQIFDLPVIIGQRHYPLSEILQQLPTATPDQDYLSDQAVSQLGVGIHWYRKDIKCLAIHPSRACKRFEAYGARDLKQILLRVPKAMWHPIWLCSKTTKCVIIPWDVIEEHVLSGAEDR